VSAIEEAIRVCDWESRESQTFNLPIEQGRPILGSLVGYYPDQGIQWLGEALGITARQR